MCKAIVRVALHSLPPRHLLEFILRSNMLPTVVHIDVFMEMLWLRDRKSGLLIG